MAAIRAWLFVWTALLLWINPQCVATSATNLNTCFDPKTNPLNSFLALIYRSASFGKRVDGPPIPCVNLQHLSPPSLAAYPPLAEAVEMSDVELWNLLHNASHNGICSLVFFYAKWCPFSAKAATKVNALGKMFHSLPVVAIDLTEYEWVTVDYVIAYYPSIALFYNSKVAKRFDPSTSIEAMQGLLSNLTGLLPVIDKLEDDYIGPLPTTPTQTPNFVLISAISYLTLLLVFYITKRALGWKF